MAGFILPIKEIMFTVAALIIVIVLIGLGTSWFGLISDWQNNLIPSGPLFYSPDDVKAVQSIDALVCAVNSVSTGEEYSDSGCKKYFESGDPDSLIQFQDSELDFPQPGIQSQDSELDFPQPGIGNTLCRRVSYYYYCADVCQEGDEMKGVYNSPEECENAKKKETTSDFVKKEPISAKLSCNTEHGEFKCTVSDFIIPQEHTESWIGYHGDPLYLAYWQQFPPEEDTWNFHVSGSMYMVMAIIALIPWGKVIGTAGKGILSVTLKGITKVGGKRAVEWTASKFMNYVIKSKLMTTIVLDKGVTGNKAVTQRFLRRSLNRITQKFAGALGKGKTVVKNSEDWIAMNKFINGISKKETDAALDKTLTEMTERGALAASDPDAYIREFSEEYANNLFNEVGLRSVNRLPFPKTGLGTEVKEQMIKELNENLFLVAAREATRQNWANMILKAVGVNGLNDIPKYALRSGTKFALLSGGARALEIADSIIDARETEHANSIVLKKPLNEPIIFNLDSSMEGRPIIVDIPNVDGYWLTPNLWDKEKSFYFASPCHLDKLEVVEKEATCGVYKIDKINNVKTCSGNIDTERSRPYDCDEDEIFGSVHNFIGGAKTKEFYLWIQQLEEIPEDMSMIEYNEEDHFYVIPVGKEKYFYFYPSSTNNQKGIERTEEVNGGNWENDISESEGEFTILPYNHLESQEILSYKILDCFDDNISYERTCGIFSTENMDPTHPITEDHIENWMCSNEECTQGVLAKRGQHELVKKAIDLIGHGLTNLDNMDWDIDSIGQGEPTFIRIYWDGSNEVHIDKFENDNVITVREKDENGNTLLERDIMIYRHGPGILDIDIPLTYEAFTGRKIEKLPAKIKLSDLGDDGYLRSITVVQEQDEDVKEISQESISKTLLEKDFGVDGIDEIQFTNCGTNAIFITEMVKDENFDPNYCTRGKTAGKAWVEFGGDVAKVVGITAALFGACVFGSWISFGGSCITATSVVVTASSLISVAGDAYANMGGWPYKTWAGES